MVFHKNTLTLEHGNGATLTFNPLEALKRVRNEKLDIKVSMSEEWHESRSSDQTKEKVKPFDWTFSTDYHGTSNDKFVIEPTDMKIDKFKLMVKEQILFYNDLTLFEDELHDNGTSVCSVKIVSCSKAHYRSRFNSFFACSVLCRPDFTFSSGSSCASIM
jgi:type 2A phosphatase activator TIP41